MASTRDRAICIRKFEYSETSQILTLFCRRAGVVRVIAKGAHRRTKAGASKFDGGIDLLDLGDAVFIEHTNRELSTLTEWKLIDGHLALRTNLRGLLLGQYLSEVLWLLLGEHDPHAELFDRFAATLPLLATPQAEEAFLAMHLDILRDTGYLPDFTTCANCGNLIEGRTFYTPLRAGLVCHACAGRFADRVEIDPRRLRLAEAILSLPRDPSGVLHGLPSLTRQQTSSLNAFLARQVQQIAQRPLQTLRSLQELS